MKKVSVIVGAYNARDTLARCLTTLVHQTLEDIEIIVVNDASQDDTWEIMERCRSQFPDKVITVNNEQNMGCGGAKDSGLDVASGEYIGFCDADDFCATNMYELLYARAKEMDADIVDCGFFAEQANASTITTQEEAEGILDDDKRKMLILRGGYLCTKLFRRELFNDPPVRLRKHVRALDDNDVLKYMYLHANNIWTVREVLYNYSDAPGSLTKIMDVDKYFDSIYGVMEGTYERCHELPTYEAARLIIEYAQLVWYSYGINRCIYDQIVKYGVGESKISLYFEEVDVDIEEMLVKLAQLKKKVISLDYKDNPEVQERISPIDIKIMQECDRRYEI
ncbi:MAG: glycosyltransferase [Butyrivibrio sp.]|nr:glycosyltransferase [Butyrivibrio sp.]